MVSILKKSSQNKLKKEYRAIDWTLKRSCGSIIIDHYPIITSILKIAYIISVTKILPERDGSAIHRIKTNNKVL